MVMVELNAYCAGAAGQDTAAQSINFAWLYNSRIVARKNHNFLAAAPG